MKRILFFLLGWGLYSQNLVEEWKVFLSQNDPSYQRILLEGQSALEAYYDNVYAELWPSLILSLNFSLSPTPFTSSGFDWLSSASLAYTQSVPFLGSISASVEPSVTVSSDSGVSRMSLTTSLGVSQTFLPDFSQGIFQPTLFELTQKTIDQSEVIRQNRLIWTLDLYTRRKLQEYFFLSIAEQQKMLYKRLLDWYLRLENDLNIRFQQGVLTAVELQERLSGRREILTFLENIHFTLVSYGPPIFPQALLESNQMKDWLTRLEATFLDTSAVNLFELDYQISFAQADLGFLQSQLGWAAVGFTFSSNFSLSGSTSGLTQSDLLAAWDNLLNQNWSRNWTWSLNFSVPLMPYDPAYRLYIRRAVRKNDYLANIEQLKLQFERAQQLRNARTVELAQQVVLRERLTSLERDRLELLRVKLAQGRATPLEVEYQEIQTQLAELSEIQLRGTKFFSGIMP